MNRLATAFARRVERAKGAIEQVARKPYALWVLFAVALVEASLFPIPPDVLLIALGVARPRRAFLFGAVCVAGSVTGALVGYGVGYALFAPLGGPLIGFLGLTHQFGAVLLEYREHAWLTILLAGFTTIPFSVFTVAAGYNATLTLQTLMLASLVGRTVRFALLAALLYLFGPAVEKFLSRYLPAVTLAVSVLFILALLAGRLL